MMMNARSAIRTLIVDDFRLVRLGLAYDLQECPDIDVVGEAKDGESAMACVRKDCPDLILMDLGLPGMSGVDATREIRAQYPMVKILVLTSHNEEKEVIAAFNAGANGYCLKDIPAQQLIEAIRAVNSGVAWIDSALAPVANTVFAKAYDEQECDTIREFMELLSSRELDVLRLMVKGKSNLEIADQLHVSKHTVKTYVSNILQKMDVKDRVEAAVMAVKAGLV